VLINETASRLVNEITDMTNDGSLQQAEIIGKKITIGMAGLRQYKRSKTGGIRDLVVDRNDAIIHIRIN
jgi:hypothetical protein